MYKYKLCSTYGYLSISISSVTPTGDLDKYKSIICHAPSPVPPRRREREAQDCTGLGLFTCFFRHWCTQVL